MGAGVRVRAIAPVGEFVKECCRIVTFHSVEMYVKKSRVLYTFGAAHY